MTQEGMHPNVNDDEDKSNESQLTDEVDDKMEKTKCRTFSNECIALLKQQQLIFAQLLREEAKRAHPRRPRSVSGYKLFRTEQQKERDPKKDWNALSLATRARYHELAAEKIRLYKERLHR